MESPRGPSRTDALLSWLRFTLGVAGSFYVLMTLSLCVHEVLGHAVTRFAFGAPSLVISVGPGFAGYVRGDQQPPTPFARWVVTLAGIGANSLVGGGALVLARWRRPTLTPVGLLHFWVITTELGQALGYTLMGLLFNQGDAENLPLGNARFLVAAVVFLAFLALASWSLGTIARFVRDHFQPANLAGLRRTLALGFGLPIGVLVILAPMLPGRELWTRIAFDAGILAVLAAGTFWMVRDVPPETEAKGHPITWREAAAWTSGAAATFAVTYVWLDAGVTVRIR